MKKNRTFLFETATIISMYLGTCAALVAMVVFALLR